MIILLLVFIVQFSVSCACLALNQGQQSQLLEVGWNNTASARNDIQRNLNCCGFRNFNPNDTCLASCFKDGHSCPPCAPIIGRYAGEVLRFVGGIGLFFSFTEILGVWLTYRYRNQKDPRANPSAFLWWERRKIFHILVLSIFSSFTLSRFAHLTKETVAEKLHYQQWNYIFLFFSFSKCFSFSIAEKDGNSWSLLTLGGTCDLLCSQCLALSTVSAEILCMTLLCQSYCETKYAFHWNNCI